MQHSIFYQPNLPHLENAIIRQWQPIHFNYRLNIATISDPRPVREILLIDKGAIKLKIIWDEVCCHG